MSKKPLVFLAGIGGILFLVLAFLYFTTSAQSLPQFIPGYQAGLTKIHRTHGIASVIVALLLFAFAWFQTGKKSTKQ